MARFPEADKRLFAGVFVCKQCKTKRRAAMQKVLNNKVPCKSCGAYRLRVKRKKK